MNSNQLHEEKNPSDTKILLSFVKLTYMQSDNQGNLVVTTHNGKLFPLLKVKLSAIRSYVRIKGRVGPTIGSIIF